MAANQSNDAAGSSNNRWPENAVNQDGSPADIQWSEKYKCFTVNGVLAPLPLSSAPLDTEQEPSVVGDSSGRQKHRNSMVFKLFKFVNGGEKYLLELYVPDTGVTTWHLIVLSRNTTWVVRVTTLMSRNHVNDVQLLSKDPNPPIFKKAYKLTLAERLIGWTFVKNTRKDGKEEKFYYYQNKYFRSFYSVVTFIIYANDAAKDLELMEREAAAEEPSCNVDPSS